MATARIAAKSLEYVADVDKLRPSVTDSERNVEFGLLIRDGVDRNHHGPVSGVPSMSWCENVHTFADAG